MNKEQKKKVVEALVDFVVRVAEGKQTSGTEVEVLPEVVKALIELDRI